MKNIEIYSSLCEINISDIKETRDRFLVLLSKANLQFCEYKNVVKTNKNIEKCFENLVIEERTFSDFVEFSIILNKLEQLVQASSKKEEEIKKLKNYSFNTNLFYNYYFWKKYNREFNLKKLMDLSKSTEEKSLLSYVISIIVGNKKEKLKYLKMSYKLCNDNLAAAKELIDNDDTDILTSETIEMLLQLDKNLALKIKPNKESEKIFPVKFLPLGGGDDIGASCYLLQLDDNNIIIDCGVKFLGDTNVYVDFKAIEKVCPIEKINIFIITHAHLDHCGGMLKLLELNPSIKVIMSRETRDLIKINMGSLNSQLGDKNELEKILNNSIIIDFRKKIDFLSTGMNIELFKAGHILGASSIYINYKGYGTFITGDYCLHSQNTISGMDIPKGYNVDLLITENTYGNKEQVNIHTKKEIYDEFRYYVCKKINEGKKILIPSFAIGRAQELIMILKDVAKEFNFRLYVDGIAKEVSEVYEIHTGIKLRENKTLFVSDAIYKEKVDFIEQEFMTNKSCVITSSGMLKEGSSAIEYAKKVLNNENGVCILTGYQADDTIGARLKAQMEMAENKYINIEDQVYKIKCELIEFNLSAHCSNEEILTLIYELKPKNVILVHGNVKEEETIIYKILNENKNLNIYQSRNKEVIMI